MNRGCVTAMVVGVVLAACGTGDGGPSSSGGGSVTAPASNQTSVPASPTPSSGSAASSTTSPGTVTYGLPLDLGAGTATGINNAGVVVGTVGGVGGDDDAGSVGADDARAVWWPTPTGPEHDLDVAPGELTFGVAVNDAGWLLVSIGHPECPHGPTVVDPSAGTATTMPFECGSGGWAQPWEMNDRGEVVVNGGGVGVVWDSTTGRTESPPGMSGHEVVLTDIDSRGNVVGHDVTRGTPFFWDRTTGEVHFLDLGGAASGTAVAVNDRGQIVGCVGFGLESRVAVWGDDTARPELFGDAGLQPEDINEAGVVVGQSQAIIDGAVSGPTDTAAR